MQRTIVDGVSMWSIWQPQRDLFFNSFFMKTADGNLVVDPLELSPVDAAQIEAAGGVAWIVVTNRDHARETAALAQRFGAKIAASALDAPALPFPVDRALEGGDDVLGARVVALDGLKTAGEIALHLRGRDAVILGDALWGEPAGSVRLMPDDLLGDAARAALSLRRVAALRPKHLLVGDGACIFNEALPAIWACLEARRDVYVNKINVDEAAWDERPGRKPPYGCAFTDLDFEIGAEKLGYRVVRLPAGNTFCPLHWHTAEEELFVVLSGEPTLVTERGTWPLRKGDYVAFPTRAAGAHKLINASAEPCEVLMVANVDDHDVCSYPDSRKVLVGRLDLLLRDNPSLDYYDGE